MKTTMSRTFHHGKRHHIAGIRNPLITPSQARDAMVQRAQSLLESDPYYTSNLKQLSTRIHQGKVSKDMMRRVQPSIAAESFRRQNIPLVEARRLLPLVTVFAV
jgi:hypothetical protein